MKENIRSPFGSPRAAKPSSDFKIEINAPAAGKMAANEFWRRFAVSDFGVPPRGTRYFSASRETSRSLKGSKEDETAKEQSTTTMDVVAVRGPFDTWLQDRALVLQGKKGADRKESKDSNGTNDNQALGVLYNELHELLGAFTAWDKKSLSDLADILDLLIRYLTNYAEYIRSNDGNVSRMPEDFDLLKLATRSSRKFWESMNLEEQELFVKNVLAGFVSGRYDSRSKELLREADCQLYNQENNLEESLSQLCGKKIDVDLIMSDDEEGRMSYLKGLMPFQFLADASETLLSLGVDYREQVNSLSYAARVGIHDRLRAEDFIGLYEAYRTANGKLANELGDKLARFIGKVIECVFSQTLNEFKKAVVKFVDHKPFTEWFFGHFWSEEAEERDFLAEHLPAGKEADLTAKELKSLEGQEIETYKQLKKLMLSQQILNEMAAHFVTKLVEETKMLGAQSAFASNPEEYTAKTISNVSVRFLVMTLSTMQPNQIGVFANKITRKFAQWMLREAKELDDYLIRGSDRRPVADLRNCCDREKLQVVIDALQRAIPTKKNPSRKHLELLRDTMEEPIRPGPLEAKPPQETSPTSGRAQAKPLIREPEHFGATATPKANRATPGRKTLEAFRNKRHEGTIKKLEPNRLAHFEKNLNVASPRSGLSKTTRVRLDPTLFQAPKTEEKSASDVVKGSSSSPRSPRGEGASKTEFRTKADPAVGLGKDAFKKKSSDIVEKNGNKRGEKN